MTPSSRTSNPFKRPSRWIDVGGLVAVCLFATGCWPSVAGSNTPSSPSTRKTNQPVVAKSTVAKSTVTVSVGSSLAPVIGAVSTAFSKMHPEITLAVNAGGSGQLAQQILGGATVDLFLPATDDWIAKLTEQNKVARHKLLLRNRLALAWRSDYAAAVPLDKLAEVSGPRLAIGHPESVPVGKYARQAMKKLGVWDKISSDLILANDVREVLAYIERGDVDAGFVYVTDIAGKPGARYELVPAELTDPIRYPAILIGETPSEAATAFYEFLSEPAAQEAFKSAGFEIEP